MTVGESGVKVVATYVLRYFFDPGSCACLWAANDAAREKFGYAVAVRSLPLPENAWRRLNYLMAWYDTSIDWDYPPDPSPWDDDEWQRFNTESQKMLTTLKEHLGTGFEIVDETKLYNSDNP